MKTCDGGESETGGAKGKKWAYIPRAVGSPGLPSLMDSITTSPDKELDIGLITSIKHIVRLSDDNVRLAFHLLMDKLKTNHSQVRYLGLLVVDELFTRSKLFRSLLVSDFEKFMLLTVGYRSDYPLPKPPDRAMLLKAKSMEILEKWNDTFGIHYRQLHLGYEYLKDTLRLQFPNLRQAASQREQERKEREVRSQILIQKKYEAFKEHHPSFQSDVQSTLTQIEQCFSILVNANKDLDTTKGVPGQYLERNVTTDDADDDFEEFGVKYLRHSREDVLKDVKELTPHETGDNKAVFDTLRDLLKLVVNQHIPQTQEWLSVLIKADPQDKQSHNSLLKSIIDLQNQLLSAKNRSIELGLDLPNREVQQGENNVEDIIWEVGETTGFIANGDRVVSSEHPSDQQEHIVGQDPEAIKGTEVLEMKKISSVKQQLFEQAPVLPWGSFLDRWGTEDAIPANQRGLMLENHWGKVDYDVLIPADKFTALNVRASYYKPQELNIQPCLAPLKDGKLCQRQDMRTCPFHGPIVPRDATGKLILENKQETNGSKHLPESETKKCNEESLERLAASISGASKDDILRDIASEAVTNIRKKNEVERSTRGGSQLQRKRDRLHNDAVLRAAGLAHTSQGLGEILGEDLERLDVPVSGTSERRKKQKSCLRALLQKKPTSKDRLAQKLLSGQIIDATIRQLTREEDTAYREAFPNQW